MCVCVCVCMYKYMYVCLHLYIVCAGTSPSGGTRHTSSTFGTYYILVYVIHCLFIYLFIYL